MATDIINEDHANQIAKQWDQHRAAASAEGWDIFWSTGSAYYAEQFQLQGFDCEDEDCPAPFAGDDGAAWHHVWAGTGAHHVAAREFLREYSPEEYARIDDFVVRGIKPVYVEQPAA